MNKKIIWVFLGIVVLAVAYYLISPLWRNVRVDESSPLEVNDALETMDEATRAEFERQTEEVKDTVMKKDEASPTSPVLLAKAEFHARAHEVEGEALLIDTSGEKIVRFENFETINGPDLRIYLSADLSNDDFIDLGAIRATEGNVNYILPAGTDTSRYNKVLVWCRAFRVLFSYADLSR